MRYLYACRGNLSFIFDEMTRKCGVFNDNGFVGFSTFGDKDWNKEVGVIALTSNGLSSTSVLVNFESKIVGKSTLDLAREVKKAGGIFKTFIFRGQIDVHKVNGYLFLYNSLMEAKKVMRLCNI